MSRTTNHGQVVLEDSDGEISYVNVIEEYEGDRPDFRTVKVTLLIADDEGEADIEIEITKKDCLRMAQMFLNVALQSFWNQPRA